MNTQLSNVSPSQLAWLSEEVGAWRAEGLVTDENATGILGRYVAVRRLTMARLMLTLGSGFVGVGLIWLVAANLDQFPPLGRFAVVTVLWLAVVVAAHRGSERRRSRGLTTPSPIVGAARGLAALAYGAVLFQAAQSLQVPAYEPSLVGYWSLGALLYAYAVRALAPLVVGIVAGVVWLVMQLASSSDSGLDVVLGLLLAAIFCVSISAVQERWSPPSFAMAWREIGAALLLIGLFTAAVPDVNARDFEMSGSMWLLTGLSSVVAIGSSVLAQRLGRYEILGAEIVASAGVGLVLWNPVPSRDYFFGSESALSPMEVVAAAASVAAYIGVAGAVAALGVLRDSARLPWFAVGSLVVFTTFQSFAVFARIMDGAWLFVALGAIFVGTGLLVDRARRELENSLEGVEA